MVAIAVPRWPWQTVLNLAGRRGVQVWLVGGAVRDLLLDRPVHDWDFAVDGNSLALARSVADTLGGAYYPLDAERGTGRVILTDPDGTRLVLDFAALRGPNLDADLSARDFTINALAIDAVGILWDPTGGQADLAARRIRFTGDHVFRDDPLRLLRAIRVAGELGFDVEPNTLLQIRCDSALVAQPSPERVRDELMRLIALREAARVLQRLDELGILPLVLPELAQLKGLTQSPPHRFDVWRHTLVTVDTLQGVVDTLARREVAPSGLADAPGSVWTSLDQVLGRVAGDVGAHLAEPVSGGYARAAVLKLAALLHDIGKSETWQQDEDNRIHFYDHGPAGARLATARMRQLRFGSTTVGRVRKIIAGHLRPAHLARAEKVTRRAVYRYYRALGDAGVDVVLLSLAGHLATWGTELQEELWARRLDVAHALLRHYFEDYSETVDPAPLLTGRDLIEELGLRAGPELGRLLETVREAQAAGEVRTRQEALDLVESTAGGA